MNEYEKEFFNTVYRDIPQVNESLKRIADSLEKLVRIHGESMKVSVYDENGSWTGNKENEWYEEKTDNTD